MVKAGVIFFWLCVTCGLIAVFLLIGTSFGNLLNPATADVAGFVFGVAGGVVGLSILVKMVEGIE